MGRSVSVPAGAAFVAFDHVYRDDEFCDDFEFFLEDIAARMINRWPSLRECFEWIGREDRAICENSHAWLGISEYCGLVSIWAVPKSDDALASNWLDKIQPGFMREFATLRQLGTASNGEAFFRRVAA